MCLRMDYKQFNGEFDDLGELKKRFQNYCQFTTQLDKRFYQREVKLG